MLASSGVPTPCMTWTASTCNTTLVGCSMPSVARSSTTGTPSGTCTATTDVCTATTTASLTVFMTAMTVCTTTPCYSTNDCVGAVVCQFWWGCGMSVCGVTGSCGGVCLGYSKLSINVRVVFLEMLLIQNITHRNQ